LLIVSRTAAQPVVPITGEQFDGELVAVDPGGRVTFHPAQSGADLNAQPGESKARSLDVNELVRWGHPAAPRPQALVLLTGGSRLVAAAAWAGGTPIKLVEDQWIVKPYALDEIRLPRHLVRGIVFAERAHVDDRLRLEDRIRSNDGALDELILTNGDRLAGTITALADGALTVATQAGAAKLPLSRVEAITMAKSAEERSPDPFPVWAIGLRDGSVLNATSLSSGEDRLELRLAAAVGPLTGGSVSDIVFIQVLGNERLQYLSDLAPTDYKHVPYLSIEWPFRRDRNVHNKPLSVAGKQFLKGLGMHSASRITFRLDGAWRRFEADIALDDSAGKRGSVTFGVHFLQNGKWIPAANSGILRGGDGPKPLKVELNGAEAITLTVDYAERGDERDHANWLDARLVK
jgi:hypothetical protein